MPAIRLLSLALLALALGGCLAHEAVRLRREAGTLVAPSLRKAGSEEALAQHANAAGQFLEAASEFRRQRRCADPKLASTWECRPRGEQDLEAIEVTGSRIESSDVVTHNQEAGVDEGGLVKKLGDRLIVLQGGKLHVVGLREGGVEGLALLHSLDISVDEEGARTWYDEILAADGRVLLLGYNWSKGVAEILAFALGADGRLAHRGRFWIRVSDYFSGDNYGARIHGGHLLLSLQAPLAEEEPWPMWSRRDAGESQWRPLVEPAELHLPLALAAEPVAHLLLRCPLDALAADVLSCQTTGIIGARRSELYVSARAAYLAVVDWDPAAMLDPHWRDGWVDADPARFALRRMRHTLVYRLPLDASGGLAVAALDGEPANQFGFRESADGLLVATSVEAAPGRFQSRLNLLRPDDFGAAPRAPVRALSAVPQDHRHEVYRYSERALWIGSNEWSLPDPGEGPPPPLWRLPLDGSLPTEIAIQHSADRIEPLGADVLVSGLDQAAHWRLALYADARNPALRATLTQASHLPSESRSHAFNRARRGEGWVFGMPAQAQDRSDAEDEDSSDLVLFAAGEGRLRALGHLDMRHARDCGTQCDDWYGNARLVFIDSRILALSGSLLKEARLDGEQLREIRRLELR